MPIRLPPDLRATRWLRALGAGLALALAGPVLAETDPGPPPWSCLVAAACDPGGCIQLPGNMASLSVEATADPGLLRVDGRLAARFASLSEAAAAVRSGSLRSDVGLLLVEEDGLGDAIGFAAYVPSARAGTVGLSETYAALVCTGANP